MTGREPPTLGERCVCVCVCVCRLTITTPIDWTNAQVNKTLWNCFNLVDLLRPNAQFSTPHSMSSCSIYMYLRTSLPIFAILLSTSTRERSGNVQLLDSISTVAEHVTRVAYKDKASKLFLKQCAQGYWSGALPIVSNPGFSFWILSRSFGEKSLWDKIWNGKVQRLN